jgi:hypothetical protein
MLRSILSVIAGYIVMAVIVTLTTYLLGLVFPAYGAATAPAAMPLLPVVLNVLFGLIAAIAGGYTTATIALRSHLMHAAALAALIFLLGIVHAATTWNSGAPGWYLIVLPIVGAIGALAGGAIRARRIGAVAG